MAKQIRILLADDDPIVREHLANLLNKYSGLRVVASAANGTEAITEANKHLVDLALLDVDMPILDGIEAANVIKQMKPSTTVVMLTAFEHEHTLADALKVRVDGFLTKDIPVPELVELIRLAHSGQYVFGPRPSTIMMNNHLAATHRPSELSAFVSAVESLRPRHRSVFNLLVLGVTNKEIARDLHLSESSVRTYASEIYEVTGVKNRGELTVTAAKARISGL